MTPTLKGRAHRFAKEFFIAWLGVVGTVTGVAALLPTIELTMVRSTLVLFASFAVATLYAWRRTKPIHLLFDEFILDSESCRFKVQCPSGRMLARQASRIARKAYGSQPAITAERYEHWRRKNGNILTCILNGSGRVVGYFDVLPLRKEFFDELKAGVVSEIDIKPEHILAPSRVRRGARLYIAGIAVESPETIGGKRVAGILIWALLKYLEYFYGPSTPHPLVALGATVDGERLLRRFGLDLVAPGEGRKDGLPIYECEVSRALLCEALIKVPGWAATVCLSWESTEDPPDGGNE